MRILHLSSDLSGGGAQRQLCYLAIELLRFGHDVHLGLFNSGPNIKLLTDFPQDQIHILGKGATAVLGARSISNYDPRLALKLMGLVRRLRPSVIQTWIAPMDIAGGFLATAYGIPWVLREPLSALGYARTFKLRLRTIAGRTASIVVANSEMGAKYWNKIAPDQRCTVIRNGVPIEYIDLVEKLRDLRIPEDAPLVLYAGRFDPQKNVERLFHAMVDVVSRSNARVILCGAGPLKARLERMLASSGAQSRIDIWEYQQQLWPLMKRASVFASATFYEGFPNTVLEAIACRCPVVVSDIPEHREVLSAEAAEFVDANLTSSISAGILKMLNNRTLANERVRKAWELIEPLSVSRMARQYEAVYESILRHPDPRSH